MLTFEQAMAFKEGDRIYVDGDKARVFRLRSDPSKKTVLIRYAADEYGADVFEVAHDAPWLGLTLKTSSHTKAAIDGVARKAKKAKKSKKS